MAAPGLAAFFEPRRILVVRENEARDEGENGDTVPGVGRVTPDSVASLPPAVPGGIQDVETADIRSTVEWQNDLLVIDRPLEEIPAILRALAESAVGGVLLPRDGEGASRDILSAIGAVDAPVLGPGAAVWLPQEIQTAQAANDGGIEDDAEADRGGGNQNVTAIFANDPTTARSIASLAQDTGTHVGPVVGVGEGADVDFGSIARHLATRESVGLVLGRATDVHGSIVESVRSTGTDTAVTVFPNNGPDLETERVVTVPGSRVSRSILEQAGAIAIDSLDRMVEGAPALANQPVPEPKSVVVVSNAGGPGVMAIDAVGASGLEVARLTDRTVEELESVIPSHGSARNPLDLLADSGLEVFDAALDATLADQNVGAAVVLSAPSALFSFETLAEIIVDARRRHELPIVTVLMGGSRTARASEILRGAGIPNYFDPYRAVGALDLLRMHADSLPRRRRDGSHPDIDMDALSTDGPNGASIKLRGEGARTFARRLGVDAVDTAGESAVEMFVSGVRTPERGPMVVTGVSTFADAVDDTAIAAVPLAASDAREMLESLRAAPLLEGARGRGAVNTEPVIELLLGVSELLYQNPEVVRVSVPNVDVTADGIDLDSIQVERLDS